MAARRIIYGNSRLIRDHQAAMSDLASACMTLSRGYVHLILPRQLAHCCLKHSCIHKVLEVRIGEVCLHELRLFFQHPGYDVDDVIVEGYLCYLSIPIADGIDEINAAGNSSI